MSYIRLPLQGTKILSDVEQKFGDDDNYWWVYNSSSNALELHTTDSDGAGTDATLISIPDGEKRVSFASQAGSDIAATLTPGATTQTVDFMNGNCQVIDLGSASGTVTLTLSNAKAGFSYCIKLIQGATARQLTWPGTVKFEGGSAPSLTTTDDAVDVFFLVFDGTSFYCSAMSDVK